MEKKVYISYFRISLHHMNPQSKLRVAIVLEERGFVSMVNEYEC